jgi:uncharacterized membrane protein
MTFPLRFAALFFTGILVGTMFGVWLGFDPHGLSARAYVEMQQGAIRGMNVSVPLLGLACILFILALASRAHGDVRWLLAAAALCLAASGLVTRFGNQPINAVVMTWTPDAPPADWQELRDRWWNLHVLRTSTALLGLALLVTGTERGRRA